MEMTLMLIILKIPFLAYSLFFSKVISMPQVTEMYQQSASELSTDQCQ